MKYLSLFILLLTTLSGNAQDILGVVTDSKKEPIFGANVVVHQNGIIIAKTVTDFDDGKYSIKLSGTGLYAVTVSYPSFKTSKIADVVVPCKEKIELDLILLSGNPTDTIIKVYKKLSEKRKANGIFTSEEIKRTTEYGSAYIVALLISPPRQASLNSNGVRKSYFELYVDKVLYDNFPTIKNPEQYAYRRWFR